MTWPPDYTDTFIKRYEMVETINDDPSLIVGAEEYYKIRPVDFIQDWCITYDPRNASKNIPTVMPFILFYRQVEFIEFLLSCIDSQDNGLVEKSRDMGATWLCCAFSVWLWRFWPGASIGWGSRKEALVDRIGDRDSIFEKMRLIIDYLPRFFWPDGFDQNKHLSYMRIINPDNGSTITGESGDNIGRGGRSLIYFKDESAHYERPEKIEASLNDNTDCQISTL